MEREEWLEGLQVGDSVIVDNGSRYLNYRVDTIKKITPTRRFTLTHYNQVFNNDGRERGVSDQRAWGNVARIIPVTKELLEKIERDRLLGEIKIFNRFDLLTNAQLKLVNGVYCDAIEANDRRQTSDR
jgi:hypothetical protein